MSLPQMKCSNRKHNQSELEGSLDILHANNQFHVGGYINEKKLNIICINMKKYMKFNWKIKVFILVEKLYTLFFYKITCIGTYVFDKMK